MSSPPTVWSKSQPGVKIANDLEHFAAKTSVRGFPSPPTVITHRHRQTNLYPNRVTTVSRTCTSFQFLIRNFTPEQFCARLVLSLLRLAILGSDRNHVTVMKRTRMASGGDTWWLIGQSIFKPQRTQITARLWLCTPYQGKPNPETSTCLGSVRSLRHTSWRALLSA